MNKEEMVKAELERINAEMNADLVEYSEAVAEMLDELEAINVRLAKLIVSADKKEHTNARRVMARAELKLFELRTMLKSRWELVKAGGVE